MMNEAITEHGGAGIGFVFDDQDASTHLTSVAEMLLPPADGFVYG